MFKITKDNFVVCKSHLYLLKNMLILFILSKNKHVNLV